jgi:hypothetical protein
MWVWVYRFDNNRYEVGYFDPKGEWFTDSFYDVKEDAIAQVHHLNGGWDRE